MPLYNPAGTGYWMVPPGAYGASNTAEGTWFLAARFTSMRFTLQAPAVFNRVRLGCGVASGNIEAAIGTAVESSTDTWLITKVATTGVIACPSPSSSSIAPTFTSTVTLAPGHYSLMFWCDNTTATFSHYLSNAVARAGLCFTDNGAGGSASGIPSSYTSTGYGGRSMMITLQGS